MAPWKDCGWLLAVVSVALSALSVCLGCLPETPLERFGIIGGAVTLEPKVNVGTRLDDISWKKNEDLVAELEDLWTAPRFEGRAKLDQAKGSLTIARLQASDSGEYRAEVNVGGEIQCTFFSLRILEPPKPPQLNCTASGNGIRVTCELDDPYANLNPTYEWEYQKSKERIPGNRSEISLEKNVDPLESITCLIRVLGANTSSSIPLRGCIPTGADQQNRNLTGLIAALVVLAVIVIAVVAAVRLQKRGFINCERKGRFSLKRKGKSQECEDGTEAQCLRREHSGNSEENTGKDGTVAAEAPPEAQCLHENHSGDLEENRGKDATDIAEAPPETQHLHENHSGNLEENSGKDGNDAAEAPPETQCPCEEGSGNLEENNSKGPSDPDT